VIICDDSLQLNEFDIHNKVLIQVKNPKLVFIQIVTRFFVEKPIYGIHPSAIIHNEAVIDENVYIGPLTYIGRSKIGEGTVIYGNVHIYDNVTIGKNVTIEAGCSIGATGYNFAKDENGKLYKFPHLGGVIIEDDVDIQALSVIDKGVLEDTIIGKGTKIDSCCYIAHNCKIGENNAIIGHTMLSGSVKTGKNCWISPGAIVRDGIKIDSDSFIGMGSIVVSEVKQNSIVMGNPARPIDEMKIILNKFKTFIKNEK
jgi:UDP-3-O-[3-hydroxymyristoyl] glucosamine N-acyltransferase